jgi:hypothetical protein
MGENGHWWTRAARKLSRGGLLWLALTAVALSSLVSSGAGAMAGGRLVTGLNLGATGKLKANPPGAAAVLPKEANRPAPHEASHPEGDVKRAHASGMPTGLVVASGEDVAAVGGGTECPASVAEPELLARAFHARAPPRPA